MTGHTSLLTIRQAAVRYGLPETAVRRWTKTGELPTLKSGTRAYINVTAIERFIDAQAQRTGTNAGA